MLNKTHYRATEIVNNIFITSRPHDCTKRNVSRKIDLELVEFGMEETREYAEKSLSSEVQLITIFYSTHKSIHN